jgi:hypothetical protein
MGLLVCPTEEKLNVSGPIRSVKCVQLCSICYAKEVSALWSYALPGPYGAGTCPPPPRAPAPPSLPGHWGFSLLVVLKKDGSRQCSGHSQAAQSETGGYRTAYGHIVLYFSSINTVFWNIPQLVYLNSTDFCYIFFIFRFD